MDIAVWSQTDIGLKRQTNQDSYLVDKDLKLFVVADGMGGHKGGEVASSIAVKTAHEITKDQRNSSNPLEGLYEVFRESSRRIYQQSLKDSNLEGMGTTMVLALIQNDQIYIANVGDSRAYLFHKPNLWQITEDHSLINEQIRAGLLSEDSIRSFAGKNIITRSVGFEEGVTCDILQRSIEYGDQFLLCSDGLTGMISDEEISSILNQSQPEEVVNKCVKKAKEHGGEDNITVVYIYISK